MKSLCIASAALEMGAGLALLCVPTTTVDLLLGVPLSDPAALTVARIGGAGLLALGLACWLVRNEPPSPAARGLLAGMLLYNVLAASLLAFAGTSNATHGPALWPGVILHAAMAAWCVVSLRGTPR